MPLTPQELYEFQQYSTADKDAEIASLNKELGRKEMEINALKSKLQAMEYLATLNPEPRMNDAEKKSGMRYVIEKLVAYTEKLTSEQTGSAEAIKAALLSLSFNNELPEGVMDSELKERVNKLDKKEKNIEMKTDAMFKISGNDNVNIGY